MAEKEFNLTDKIKDLTGGNAINFYENIDEALDVNDVKTFIIREERLITQLILNQISDVEFWKKRNKLAGDKIPSRKE